MARFLTDLRSHWPAIAGDPSSAESGSESLTLDWLCAARGFAQVPNWDRPRMTMPISIRSEPASRMAAQPGARRRKGAIPREDADIRRRPAGRVYVTDMEMVRVFPSRRQAMTIARGKMLKGPLSQTKSTACGDCLQNGNSGFLTNGCLREGAPRAQALMTGHAARAWIRHGRLSFDAGRKTRAPQAGIEVGANRPE
jgi:hypothetical protein